MKTLIPPIVLVAAGLIFAGSIEPEYKSWTREQLETEYVQLLEETAQLRRELAVARKQLADLQPPEVETEVNEQPALPGAGAAKRFGSIEAMLRSIPADRLARGLNMTEFVTRDIGEALNATCVGSTVKVTGTAVSVDADGRAFLKTRVRVNGAAYTFDVFATIPAEQARGFSRGSRQTVEGVIESVSGSNHGQFRLVLQ